MKILITGGTGYLAGRLAEALSHQRNFEIIVASRNSAKNPIDWNSATSLNKICNNIDVVVHLAGMNAQDCSSDPAGALLVNGVNTAKLLEASIQNKVKRFIYLSTAHVYASPLVGTISEETAPKNLHSYATSHRAGEDVVRLAHSQKKIEGIVIRLSNSFGAPIQKEANCWMLLANDLCKQAIQTNQMILHSSGKQRRDFIAISEACKAIKFLIELNSEKLQDGVFNIAGEWSPTIAEMAQRVANRVQVVTGTCPTLQFKTDTVNELSHELDYRMDKLKALGFNSAGNKNIDQEIDRLIEFCRKNFGVNQ